MQEIKITKSGHLCADSQPPVKRTGVMPLWGWVLTIFGSLIAFPNVIVWCLGFWMVVVGVQWFRSQSVAAPLAVCLAILLIKQPGWTPSLIVFLSIGTVLLVMLLVRKTSLQHLAIVFGSLCAVFCWFVLDRWHQSNCGRQYVLDFERPVVCLGDSLTDCGYPQDLEQLISIPVADFGRDGYTTTDAIEKLLPEIVRLKPQVAIVELGGHDYKDGQSREQTRANLVVIIERLQKSGAQVVLVEIPRGFISDPYAGLERELCGKYDLQLIPDSLIRRFIYFSPILPPGSWMSASARLSDDGLHPNLRGNRLFAEYVRFALIKLYGVKVKR